MKFRPAPLTRCKLQGDCERADSARRQETRKPLGELDVALYSATPGPSRPSPFTELAALSWRTFTDVWRSPNLLLLHLGIAAVMGVAVGAIFRNLTLDIAGAQGRLGVVFFTLCLAALTSLTTVDLLTNERGLAVREIQAGYYRPVTYYISKGMPWYKSPLEQSSDTSQSLPHA